MIIAGSHTGSEDDHAIANLGLKDVVGDGVPENITTLGIQLNLKGGLHAKSEFGLAATAAIVVSLTTSVL